MHQLSNEGHLKNLLESHFATTTSQQLSRLVARYRQIYDLYELAEDFPCDGNRFDLLRDGRDFVVVAIFDRHKHILVGHEKDRSRFSFTGPHLVGATVEGFSSFCLEDAASDLVLKKTGLSVVDLEPIAIVTNTFSCGGSTKTHNGVAFAAYVDAKQSTFGDFVFCDDPPPGMILQNEGIFKVVKESICGRRFESPLDEAMSGDRHPIVAAFHHYFFKKILHFASSRRIRRRIKTNISRCDSYLDASCGDDTFILEISRDFDPMIIIANDVSWAAGRRLRAKARRRNYNITFTNHNLCDLPFQIKFDAVVWKNTMHHLRSEDELLAALNGLGKIAEKLIIVDIEDPIRTLKGRIINMYYEKVYGDAGEDHVFFTRSSFRNIVQAAFPTAQIDFQNIWTVKGTYLLAAIDLS